ncbi:hypothetical protein Rhe02_36350 [Rhizocola hellebori]|uniref:Uncharacterized protein n=1 Tax=Rhizocola hellebori TaxID=1392758 RepID=A0A8J3Q7J6_9ACTN|nr:hypothetical protein [Rhizocola hellebori]GIH05568.1 hypothetical protein Rhe02_36350 [Rhizocola hellebori]
MTTTSQSADRKKRSVMRGLAVMTAALISTVVLGATPAHAESGQKCTGGSITNVCLSIWPTTPGEYVVHVGIDYRIGRQRAQAIIDQPGDPYRVRIFGVAPWPWGNQAMFDVPLTNLGASEESGLSGDFEIRKTAAELNRDLDWFGVTIPFSKVFARIELLQTGQSTVAFDSDQFLQNF